MRPGVHISTVTAAAASYALVDIEAMKTRIDVTGTLSDNYFKIAIADASAAAIGFMNNAIVVETLQDQIWPWRDGRYGALRDAPDALQLARWPIVEVQSVVETIAGVATTLVQGEDFLVDPKPGRLRRLDQAGNPRDFRLNPVVVAYTAGYATVPSDLQEAISDMVKARWYARGRDPAVRSQNVEGVLQTQYGFGSGPGADTDMPPSIQAKLERYRVPVIS